MKNLTKKEISKKLMDLGIEHNIRLTKDELVDLLSREQEKAKKKKAKESRQRGYIVTYRFKDLQDNNKIYRPGDSFDIEGKKKERIKELSTTNNKIGKILIKEQG